MRKYDYGMGLPSIVNGTTESEQQLQQRARNVVAKRLGIDPRSMVERMDKGSANHGSNDIARTAAFNYEAGIDPTVTVKKPGEFGYPGFWKSQKELDDYLADKAKWSKRIHEFRQDPKWVAEHNQRFPSFKTTVIPKTKKQQLQENDIKNEQTINQLVKLKKFANQDRDTYPSNPAQRRALADAEKIENAVKKTKQRINNHHKDFSGRVVSKTESLKDLQNVTDFLYKESDKKWTHQPKWEFDKKTGDPIDVADPANKKA